ncbi:hypothetical protein SXAG_00158 [Synechococcus phage S-CBS4]|nr:hypothetical protein SXAG_00158 [Synechococcus phage S-CBS4]
MALVVEDGSGLSGANSYATAAQADTYASDRGLSAWTGDTATKEAALIRATDYLEATYREAWLGYRATKTQALSWPRTNVEVDLYPIPADEVPVAVRNATIEMAIRALTEDLLADQTQRVKREKVDVLEIEYADGSDATKRYPFVGRMLSPYIYGGSAEGGAFSTRVLRT